MPKVKKDNGRPKLKIDWEQFDKLCEIQCTAEEIALVLGVSKRTLQRRCKAELGETFDTLFKKRSIGGHHTVKRAQYQMAQNIPVMSIWWGKQYMGQSDTGQSSPDTIKPIQLIKVNKMVD